MMTSDESSIVFNEAYSNFAKVDSAEFNNTGKYDDSKLYSGSLSSRASSSTSKMSGKLTKYKNTIIEDASSFTSNATYYGTQNNEINGSVYCWIGDPSDSSSSGYLSMYYAGSYTQNGISNYLNSESSKVCKVEERDYTWSRFGLIRFLQISNEIINTSLSINGLTGAHDGEKSIVFYGSSISISSTTSMFVDSSNEDHIVRYENVTNTIIRLVKNEDFGWVVSSVACTVSTNYYTDVYGALLNKPLNIESSSGYVKYTYTSKSNEEASHPNFDGKNASMSNSVQLNAYDSSTYALLSSSNLFDISDALLYESTSNTDHLFVIEAQLFSSSLYSLGDNLHKKLETPVSDVWGFNSITNSSNSYIILDGNVSGHNFFKVKNDGIYQIKIRFNSDFSTLKSLSVTI